MSEDTSNQMLRSLPSVSALLETDQLRAAAQQFGPSLVSSTAKQAVAQLRSKIQRAETEAAVPTAEEIAAGIAAQLQRKNLATLRPVINATGILLHTGLGRAPLAPSATQAIIEASSGYCNVELDLATGERMQRSQHVTDLLCQLTGAEAAHVVNNNAGALALSLAALASDREVIVSHGELIEIGGGYRLPDVIETFGARLKPVGTTNKTRTSDYQQAITDQTGALLVVHPSNYAVTGFTQSPQLEELAEIAQQHSVPLVHDIGSGALIDFAQFGCQAEPVAAASIAAGADLVLFSGDKLLGGPQAGIIVGKGKWLDRVAPHPLNRALRVDKITLAALKATLELYRRPEEALNTIPLLRFLQTSAEELETRANNMVATLSPQLPDWEIATGEDQAFIGGGSVPTQAIESRCIILSSTTHDVQQLTDALRLGNPPVVPRIEKEQLILGLHAVFPEQDGALADAILQAVEKSQ